MCSIIWQQTRWMQTNVLKTSIESKQQKRKRRRFKHETQFSLCSFFICDARCLDKVTKNQKTRKDKMTKVSSHLYILIHKNILRLHTSCLTCIWAKKTYHCIWFYHNSVRFLSAWFVEQWNSISFLLLFLSFVLCHLKIFSYYIYRHRSQPSVCILLFSVLVERVCITLITSLV